MTSISRKTQRGTIYREYADGSLLIGASRLVDEPYTIRVMVDVSARGFRETAEALGASASKDDVIDTIWSIVNDAAPPSQPPHP